MKRSPGSSWDHLTGGNQDPCSEYYVLCSIVTIPQKIVNDMNPFWGEIISSTSLSISKIQI